MEPEHLQEGPAGAGHQLTTTPHRRYGEAREKAFQLETTIENAQKEYAKQLSKIIKKLQTQFYKQYGKHIQELEDLEEGISNIQYKGMKHLKRQLTQLYLESSDREQSGGGGDGTNNETHIRDKARELYSEYRRMYMPRDNYQRKRDEEARNLQRAILGTAGAFGNLQPSQDRSLMSTPTTIGGPMSVGCDPLGSTTAEDDW